MDPGTAIGLAGSAFKLVIAAIDFVGDAKKQLPERIDRLFLATLNRKPTAEEANKFSAFLTGGGPASDAVWVLMTCSEFRFNH